MQEDIFAELLKHEQIFVNKEVLRISYMPDSLPHREEEINNLAGILVSALRGETPSNVFIYGKTGTGKTAVAKYVSGALEKKDKEMNNGKKIQSVYLNCQIIDTEYGVLSAIGNNLIIDWNERIPPTGWSIDRVYSKLKETIEEEKKIAIIVLDEIDKLVSKSGDDILYILTRMNSDLSSARTSIIGISNDLKFTDLLDARVKSSLGEHEIIFSPYNAKQLQDILYQRAKLAFGNGILSEEVIPLCSALAAQEHGDARRALDLLRGAGEIAEKECVKIITEEHVKKASHKIELDRMTEVIKTLPTQSKLILLGIILSEENLEKEQSERELTTGDVYNIYRELCKELNINVLTQRRVTDLISELDMLGIINARNVSFGRYGKTRAIRTSINIQKTKEEFENDELLKPLLNFKPKVQMVLEVAQ